MIDMRKTIIPKSDQLNADDLIGGPMTIKVTKVSLMAEADQPIAISYVDDAGKPYKPCKSMRRVMVNVWGNDGNAFVGRSMTLYRDEKVMFGGAPVGGIRISHMSDIDRDMTMALTASRANRKPFTVKPLRIAAENRPRPSEPPREPIQEQTDLDEPISLDGETSDYADRLDAVIDEATDGPKLAQYINDEIRKGEGSEWSMFSYADPERAKTLKARATARVNELKRRVTA